jgi:hypothetical protein
VTFSFPSGSTTSSIARKPATLSPSMHSVTISVNGATPQIFNVTSDSGGCATSGGNTTCTFTIGAPFGLDTFLILTYSAANGTGTALNAAAETLDVTAAGPNSFSASAGNVVYVTTNADSGPGSLRAAVTGAASGVTTAVLFQGVSGTITLSSTIPITQNVAIIGPAASALSISGGGSVQMFTVASGVNAVFYGLTLTSGTVTGPGTQCHSGVTTGEGGAIFSDGILSLFSMTVANNTATSYGGAVEVDNGSLVIVGSTFTNNSVTVSSATAYQSGGGGGAVDVCGDVAVDSSTFQGNSVTGHSGLNISGGAILVDTYNPNNGNGLTLTNSRFTSNAVSGASFGYGGAVAEFSNAPNGATITNNTFGIGGAANSVGGSSSADGGAFAFFGTTLSDGGVGGNVFTGNTTSAPSGAFAASGALEVDGGSISFTGTNTFTGNSATGGSEGAGGAIAVYGGGSVNLASSTSFTSNTANATDSTGSAFGGALEYWYFPCFSPPAFIASVGQRQPQSGGNAGPRVAAARLLASSHSRTATSARRVASVAPGMISGTFRGNSANAGTSTPGSGSSAGGGAIDIEVQTGGPSFTIQSAALTSNSITGSSSAGADGGAISIFSGVVTVSGSQIGMQSAGNKAITRGGGIVVGFNGPAASSSKCSFTIYPGVLAIANSTIEGNSLSAANQTNFGGGGIANLSSTVTLSGDTIAFNSVTSSNSGGGGLFAIGEQAAATSTITNSTVYANTSSLNGGGMLNAGGGRPSIVTIVNSTVYQNTATNGFGGNAYNAANGGGNVVYLTNTILAGGTATTPVNGIANDSEDAYNADTVGSLGYNLLGTIPTQSPGTGGCVSPPGPGGCATDITGTVASPANPNLASGLANNGGPTPTIADTVVSPGKGRIPFARGVCGTSGPNVDQRGYARGAGGVCDVGAFEFAGAAP